MKYLRADLLFLISALISLALEVFIPSGPDTVLDVNVHDTYFVIDHSHVFRALTMFFGLMAFVHFLILQLKRKEFENLSLVHCLLTVLPLLGLVVLLESYWLSSVEERINQGENMNLGIGIFAWILVLGQLVLSVEIIWAITIAVKRTFEK